MAAPALLRRLAPAVARPPGPRLSRLATVRSIRRLRPTGFFEAVAAEHPRIAYLRLGTEHAYLLTAPDLARRLLVDLGRDTGRGRALERAREVLGDGLLTSEGELHRRQRRLIQPAFSARRTAGYGEVMRQEAERQSAAWTDGARVDMAAEMSGLTLRVVGRVLFGTDLTADDLRRVARALDPLLEATQRIAFAGRVAVRLPTPANRRLVAARDDLYRLVDRIVAERRASGDTGDLLSVLLAEPEPGPAAHPDRTGGAPEPTGCPVAAMSDRQVRDEALTLLLAGHETTATLLTWTWLLLADAPQVAARLHAELDALPGAPGAADLPAMPWTRAVLAESMRLYPPAWVVGRRARADLELDGWTVPAGSLVLACQWVLHRDDRWWGDGAVFRPDRWLDADGTFDEAAPGQPRGAYLPFGAGRRVCVGETFAWTEAMLLLGGLARDWAPAALPDTRVSVRPAVTLRPEGGLPLLLRRRPADPAR